MDMYEIATIILGIWVVILHLRYTKKDSLLMRTTKCLHMVALGEWTAEATETELTVYDDEGDRLMHVRKG